MAFISGNRTSFSDTDGHILDLSQGLKYLSPRNDGVELLRRIGMNGFTAKSTKHEWREVSLAARSETVTLADGSGTTLTVADAYIYQVNDLVKVESEIMRVTAIASATTLTVTRAYAGTTGAAHSSKTLVILGSADPENSAAPAGQSDDQQALYNYVQTFTRAVDLSADEIAVANVEGNALTGNLKRRYIEWMRLFSAAFFYGVRYQDSTNKINVMGGLAQFITTNPTNVGGALSITNIDAEVLQIVQAGGDPKVLVMSPTQKQKLDALDSNKIYTGKRELATGGNPVVSTWQSGVLDHTMDVLVDFTLKTDEVWILDTDLIAVGPLSNNGVNGNVHVEDATTPGQDGEKKVIRGKYTLEVKQEKGHSYLYGLT